MQGPPITKIITKVGTTHFLTTFEAPRKTIRSVTDVIIFVKKDGALVPDGHHDDLLACALDLGQHEKAIILKVSLLYAHNESKESFTCTLGPIFDAEPSMEGNQHPDTTGLIKFTIPGRNWSGVIKSDSSVIYQPNVTNLDQDIHIYQYAGMERSILEARSTAVGVTGLAYDVQLFNVTDPLFVFLMQHKDRFPELHAEDIKKRTDSMYSVKKTLVRRVQQFFENAIFTKIKYTTKEGLCFNIPEPTKHIDTVPDIIMIQLQVDYMVISPQIFTYNTQDVQLKF